MCFYVIQESRGSTDRMMPALSGINTLSKEKSVFLCYTRKSWSMRMMPALSGINTLSKEKSVFLCYTRKVVVD